MTARQLNAFTHFTNVFNGVRDYFVVGAFQVFRNELFRLIYPYYTIDQR